jgi:hypothetical protein
MLWPHVRKPGLYGNQMNVGNSVRKAIDDYQNGETDAALLHA